MLILRAWWKLVLPGLWGECCVCDLGVWRLRVVSTKLEYATSLGQVLPWGATLDFMETLWTRLMTHSFSHPRLDLG